jgi:hypothetical protein
MSTITSREIDIELTEVVAHADRERERLETEADDIREGWEGEWTEAPQEIRETEENYRQEASRQQEIVNTTLRIIDEHYLPDGGGVEDIEDSTVTFEELTVGDGFDMDMSVDVDPGAGPQAQKRAERQVMSRYLNTMCVESPDEFPDDLEDLPLALGEGLFNRLDSELEEGDTNLSASQIRQTTETNSDTS